MHLHFYISQKSIRSIHEGHEAVVRTKEMKDYGDIHASFDVEQYEIKRIADSPSLYSVKKR